MKYRAGILILCLLGFAVSGRSEVFFSTNNAVWRYFKGRSEASSSDPTAWRQPAFNDSAWLSGPAPFYYTATATEPPFYNGGPVTGTVLNDMLNDYTGIFFRKTFVVTNLASSGVLTLEVAGDDGYIVWINGVELTRTNMPDGFVPFNGRALVSVAEPVPVYRFVYPNASSLLIEGTNVLTAQGFNWDPASGDFGFMAGLSVTRVNPNAPSILTQPSDQTVSVGGFATFQVQATGVAPLVYQWLFNDVAMSGATNSSLVLTNVQQGWAGRYSVAVSNASGAVTSVPAILTVSGPCATAAAELAAWWPLNGSGADIRGTAALQFNGGPGFASGKVGQGILLDGSNDYGQAGASADLNVGTASGMTIEGWINPTDSSQLMDIVEWNNGQGADSSIGVHLSTSTGANRDFYANLVDTGGTSHWISAGADALQSQVFQHVAMTYEKAGGLAVLYVNGVLKAQSVLGSFTPQTSYNFQIGTRLSGPFQGIFFRGVLDELSLYRRALSGGEVQAIYLAGAGGKCTAPQPLAIVTGPSSVSALQGTSATFFVVAQGTAPLQFRWLFNDAPLAGATQPSLNFVSVQAQHGGRYAAVVSDVSGSVTSAPATLTVVLPLSIVTQPQNAMVVSGGNASFSVVGQGTGPLTYQWYFQGGLLPAKTNASLPLSNVQANQAGRYFVTLSDATHSVTSAPVVLNILPSLSPVITEFMAENHGLYVDEDGDASDWLEIFNPGATAVDLLGWFLTDEKSNLAKWQFPATNLAANGYMVIFASGKNRSVPGAPLHTGFKLNEAGGYLALVRPDGVTIASEFAPAYPPQRSGVSFGLGGGLVYFLNPTPGAGNDLGVPGFVADTKFSTNRGFFFGPVDVTISCATTGATLAYTLNGDLPGVGSGTQVPALNPTSPPAATIHLTTTTLLRAVAFKAGFVSSGVDTHSYVFPAQVVNQTRPAAAATTWIDDPPGDGQAHPADYTVDASVVSGAQPGYSFTNALMAIPAISLVTPLAGLFNASTGIYARPFMEGTNWERPVSVEYMPPGGTNGFHENAGIRMHGGVSRLNSVIPKHPLRLFFRSEYGVTKLEFPLFPDATAKRFDQLVLRSCSTDAWPMDNTVDFLWRNYDATYQRDQWMRDTQLAMGHLSAHGRYVQLYLNGLYWGLYNVTERLGDSFCAENLGGNKEDYDVMSSEITDHAFHVVAAGTDATWNQMMQMANLVPSTPGKYWEIQGKNPDGTRNPALPVLLDLDNLIDYMMLHIYVAAIDWPNRNWWAARRRDSSATVLDSSGYMFLVWDQEVALDRLDRTITWANNMPFEMVNQSDTPAQVYDRLRGHPEFKLRFADRLQRHLFNGGVLTVSSNVARWAARAAEIDHAIVGESARWGDAHHAPAYTRQADWLRMSNFTQNTYFPQDEALAWQRFKNVGLYPSVGAPRFNQFGGSVPANFQLVVTHTNATGVIYFTTDGSDPRLIGGAIAGTAQIYTQPVALSSPTFVRARVKSGTTWSALVEAQFYPPQDLSKLQLSEILYNPPRFGTVDGDELEFLELQNTGPATLDLSGLAFTHGITFAFTNQTQLAPGQYFVLARNPTQYVARYSGAPLHGIYTGKLDNNGENLTLSTALGAIVFSVTYNNAAPWPAEADNSGLSLQRMNFGSPATNGLSWIAAPPTPGGPLPWWLLDSDGDGMPNGWEVVHNLDPNVNDAAGDMDLDGLSNLQEFLAGSDPEDSDDGLKLFSLGVRPDPGGWAMALGFEARSNKTYSIAYRNSSHEGSWTNLAHFGTQPTNRFIVTTNVVSPEAPARFYRLVTPRLP